jgi:hypothetical protein
MALPLLGCVSLAVLCVHVLCVCVWVSALGWRAPTAAPTPTATPTPTTIPSSSGHSTTHAPDTAARAARVAARAASAASSAYRAAKSAYRAAWTHDHASVDVFADNYYVAHGSPADRNDDTPVTPGQPPAVAPDCVWFTFPFSRATITFVKSCGGRWCNRRRAWYFHQTESSSARGLAAILARCDRLPSQPLPSAPLRSATPV